MNDLNDLWDFDDVPKTKEKIEKKLFLIVNGLQNDDILSNMRSNANKNWRDFVTFIAAVSNVYFQSVAITKSVSNWSTTPTNRKIIDHFVNIYKIMIDSIDRKSGCIEINGLLEHLVSLAHRLGPSQIDVTLKFVSLFISENFIGDQCELTVDIDCRLWHNLEQCLCDLLMKMDTFCELKLLVLLKSIMSLYRGMTRCTVPDLYIILPAIDHASRLCNHCSLPVAGHLAILTNHLLLVTGVDSMNCLSSFSVDLSRRLLFKVWIDNRKHISLITDQKNSLDINHRLVIVEMWNNLYELLEQSDVDWTESSSSEWIQQIYDCITDEISYLESRAKFISHDRCVPDQMFFIFAMKMLLKIDDSSFPNELSKKRLKSTPLIEKIMDNLLEESSVSQQLLSLQMLEIVLDHIDLSSLTQHWPQMVESFTRFIVTVTSLISNLKSPVFLPILSIIDKLFATNQLIDVVSLDSIFDRGFYLLTFDFLDSSGCSLVASVKQKSASVLVTIIRTGKLSSLPHKFWNRLISTQIPTQSICNLISQVILHLGVSSPFRSLISHETSWYLLNWCFSSPEHVISSISFPDLCSFISIVIAGKSLKSGCYRQIPETDNVDSSADHISQCLSVNCYKSILKSGLLSQSFFSNPKSNIQMKIVNIISFRDSRRIELLFKFFDLISHRDSIKNLLLFVIHFFDPSIERFRKYLDLYSKAISWFADHRNSFIDNSYLFIDWKQMLIVGDHFPQIQTQISGTIQSIECFLRTDILSSFCSTDNQSMFDGKHFLEKCSSYFSLITCQLDNQLTFTEFLGNLISVMPHSGPSVDQEMRHIDLFTTFLSAIKSWKFVLNIFPIFSPILSFLRLSFKTFKSNSQVYMKLLTVNQSIVDIVLDSNLSLETKTEIINFFADLDNVVLKIVEKNFPEFVEMRFLLVKQMADLSRFYWYNANRGRSLDICRRVFSVCVGKPTFINRLVNKMFVHQMLLHDTTSLSPSRDHLDILNHLLQEYPKDSLLTNNRPVSSLEVLNHLLKDNCQAGISSFLQTWLCGPILPVNDLPELGSILLPYANLVIPDSPQKPKSISKFLNLLHTSSYQNSIDINRFVEKIMSSFILEWDVLQRNCRQRCELPGNVTVPQLIQANIDRIMWKIATNQTESEKYFSSQMILLDEASLVRTHLPTLVSRSVIAESHLARTVCEYICSFLSLSEIRSIINENIFSIFWEIFLLIPSSISSDIKTLFFSAVESLFSLYFGCANNFEKWLAEQPSRLLEVMMFLVGRFGGDYGARDSRIWLAFVRITISLNKCSFISNDSVLGILITRHLKHLEAVSKEDITESVAILRDLLRLVTNSVDKSSSLVHLFWYQQIFYFISNFWDKFVEDLSTISEIFQILESSFLSSQNDRLFDRFVFEIPGFKDLEVASHRNNQEIDAWKSIDNTLFCIEQFGIWILQYRSKSLEKISEFLFGLVESKPSVDKSCGNSLQKLNDILHSFLQLPNPVVCSQTRRSALSCLMNMKLLISQTSIVSDYQLSVIDDPALFDQINLYISLLINCLNEFGKNAWISFSSLCQIKKSIDISNNRFLCEIIDSFDHRSPIIRDGICSSNKAQLSSIVDHFQLQFSEGYDGWICQLSRMLSSHNLTTLYHKLHQDYIGSSLVSLNVFPEIFATVKFTKDDKKSLIKVINSILNEKESKPDQRKLWIVRCILKTLEYSRNKSNSWKGVDLFRAATIAYESRMYTAALFLLETLWLKGEQEQESLSTETIDLYQKCFQALGSHEELLADKFLVMDSSNTESANQFCWLLSNGKFDILRQLMSFEESHNFKSTATDVEKIDILWKLSRWGDEETFEINSIESRNDHENPAVLTMYDFLYSRSLHIGESYRDSVMDLCRSSWDQEVCTKSLIECLTLTSSPVRLPLIFDSLISTANTYNIDQLHSSITWALVNLNRSHSLELISSYCPLISDMVMRCKRPEYIGLIQDMFQSRNNRNSILVPNKCNGETEFMRLINVIDQHCVGRTKQSYLLLEQLIVDCQEHLNCCQLPENDHNQLKTLYCQAVSKFYSWNQSYPVHSSFHIRTQILDPAIKIFKNSQTPSILLDTVSTFYYKQYCHIDEYMHSAEYETRLKILSESHRNIGILGDVGDKSRFRRLLENQSEFEKDDLSSLCQDKDSFMLSAVMSCAECLQLGVEHNLKIFRLISIWLNNDKNEELNRLIGDIIDKIESYKFLVLMPQLCSRLSSDNNKHFEKNLEKLVERIIFDHPYHSIYNLLAIRNAHKDSEFKNWNVLKKVRAIKESSDKMDHRISVAIKIIEKLLKTSRGKIVKDADLLTNAYIQLANLDVGPKKSDSENVKCIPYTCPLLTIGKKIDLPVLTVFIPIDKSLEYPSNKLVKIVDFDKNYSLQRGINLPKIIWCQSSDGVKRRQLVKGKDDLRQDSVMQQVFAVVNSLFGRGDPNLCGVGHFKYFDTCEDFSGKMLNIRTYKVIPTSQTSGLIEWCENTVTLGDWLTEKGTGAHLRYRPNDLKPNDCKNELQNVRDKGFNAIIKTFKNIIQRIKPVLGYFLLENFPDPRRWFKARKLYIHSLAVNSIIGFLLGLGDRHVYNILLDLRTAELIHIDFGVAFDQGKLLPTPERVPFRLTRDLVHAMGPFGVEGRFKTICCNVLNMLRSKKDIILTLIEVLLHDPLNNWTLTAEQIRLLQAKRSSYLDSSTIMSSFSTNKSILSNDQENQNSDPSNSNQMARRIILELSRKFSGAADNSYLNSEGHVNYLIQTATDVDNLARMYFGWQAYL